MQTKSDRIKSYFHTVTREQAALEGLSETEGIAERLEANPLVEATEQEVELARGAVDKLARAEEPSPAEYFALEAIVLPLERPVIDVVGGSFGEVPAPFTHLGTGPARQRIEAALPAVGRIGVPTRPALPFAGTGFVVGDGLLITNRHVAELFARGLGREELAFLPGHAAEVDFGQELGGGQGVPFEVRSVLMIHPYWDAALLAVDGLDVEPLELLTADPAGLEDREVAVIGYPGFDARNDVELQYRIFRRVFNVKRLQPGRLRGRGKIDSFGNAVDAVTHDSSTLAGNSGSAVIEVETGKVVALHFAGRYLEANFGVPAFELARDGRVRDAGVRFSGALPQALEVWDELWRRADPEALEQPRKGSPSVRASVPAPAAARPGAAPAAGTATADRSMTWSIPLEITLRLGGRIGTAPAAAAAAPGDPATGLEAMVEPFHEDDYRNRLGYREDFLGVRVTLPEVRDRRVASKLDGGEHVIPYQHFSIVMHKERRMAIYTASNVDGRPELRRPDPTRRYGRRELSGLAENDWEKWFTDPRIPALHQLPDRFFSRDRGAFDKGHIVRRDAVCWGRSYDELRRANGDTYHVTNCSPQVAGFNRSNLGGLWGELENLVFEQSASAGERYVVIAGPILDADDPPFSGFDDQGRVSVPIPRRFWKLVVARRGSHLRSFAFLLDQDLGGVELEFAVGADWRAHMISVAGLEREIGLITFPPEIHQADQFDADAGEAVRATAGIERMGG